MDLRDGCLEALGRSHSAWAVREQILDSGTAVRLPVTAVELYVVRDFLTAPQCSQLIAVIDANRVPSPVVSDRPVPVYRTSETCYLYPVEPIVTAVEAQLDRLTGIDPGYGEALQGQRYAVGQQFKAHHDFFATDQLYWREQVVMGGQRTWTAMAFLNEPEAGGTTSFPTLGIALKPRTGTLLVWNNMDEFGEPNAATLHAGMPIEQGTKYILTKWYRERPWCP